jgi:hypothetical protein
MIEKQCISAGYAYNNINLPFKSFCGNCKAYKDAIEIGFARIDPKKHQWQNGRIYRCTRLKTWRTGKNLEEGLYEELTPSVPVLPKPTPQSVNSSHFWWNLCYHPNLPIHLSQLYL